MAFFLKLKLNYLSKMHGYPQFSFWIPRVLTKIYFLRIVLNRAKISREISSWPLEDKIHIHARACSILYVKGGTPASECIECSEKLLFLYEIFEIYLNNQTF